MRFAIYTDCTIKYHHVPLATSSYTNTHKIISHPQSFYWLLGLVIFFDLQIKYSLFSLGDFYQNHPALNRETFQDQKGGKLILFQQAR